MLAWEVARTLWLIGYAAALLVTAASVPPPHTPCAAAGKYCNVCESTAATKPFPANRCVRCLPNYGLDAAKKCNVVLGTSGAGLTACRSSSMNAGCAGGGSWGRDTPACAEWAAGEAARLPVPSGQLGRRHTRLPVPSGQLGRPHACLCRMGS